MLHKPEEINDHVPQVPTPCSFPLTEEILESVTKQATLADKESKELELLVRNFSDLFNPYTCKTNLAQHIITALS